MSSTNGKGGYSQVGDIEHVTRREYVDQEEKIDGILDDLRILDGKLTGLAAKSTSHSAAIAEVNSTVKGHSEMLANIGSAVIRIEASLKATAEKVDKVEDMAEEADEKAVRASWTNEIGNEFAKTAAEGERIDVERRRDSLAAKARRRDVFYGAFQGAFSGVGAGLRAAGKWALASVPLGLIVIAVIARSCGVEVPLLEKPSPTVAP
jgi:hypothetical protein